MKVTAILPTRGRPELASRALACVLMQTWTPFQIVIVDDLQSPSFPRWQESGFEEKGLHYLRVNEPELGNKLNLACSLASGEYIVHFHDDDWSAPGRIEDQITRLIASGKAVTTYRNLVYTDGARRWINRNWPGGFGTSLCHRRDWSDGHNFPAIESEDWYFVSAAMRANQHVAGDAGSLMLVRLTANAKVGANWEEIAC